MFQILDDYSNIRDLLDDLNINESEEDSKLNNQKELCNCDDNTIEDTTNGLLVCKLCGIINNTLYDSSPEWKNDDNNEKSRSGFCVSKLLPQSSLGTTIGGSFFGGARKIKQLQTWCAMPYRERALNCMFKELHTRCTTGNILRCIEDDAKIMIKKMYDCKHIEGSYKDKYIIVRGSARTGLMAMCVYYACKRKGMPRTLKEIADIFEVSIEVLTNGKKKFHKFLKISNLNINIGYNNSDDFVKRYCKDLHIKQEFIDQTLTISNNIKKLNIASSHTPSSLAVCSILLMADINNFKTINKKLLSKKFKISDVTLTKTLNKIILFKNILSDNNLSDIYEKNNNIIITDIPETLISKFETYKLPTNKNELSSFQYEYSKIFTDINNLLIINVDNNTIFSNNSTSYDNNSIESNYSNKKTIINKNINFN